MNPQRSRSILFLCAAALLNGCVDDRAESPVAPDNQPTVAPSAAAFLADASARAQDVARAFALAMARPEIRASVRDAMRSSRLTEHKLVLQDYIATQGGRELVAASAQAVGKNSGEIRMMIVQLPEMDFYVPLREHRLTWKGTSDLLVGATMNVDDHTFTAYRTDGGEVLHDSRQGSPELAVVLLHPAEAKGPRINPQSDVPGEVIQDADDGELSGRFISEDAAGNRRVVELADLFGRRLGDESFSTLDCDPETAIEPCEPDQPPPGPAPSDTTEMGGYQINFEDGAGSVEVEWRSWYSADGSTYTLRLECADCQPPPQPPYYMIFRRVRESSGETIRTEVWETDAFADDYYGDATFNYTDNEVWQSTYDQCDQVYDPEVCNGLGLQPWEEVEASRFLPAWTPKP